MKDSKKYATEIKKFYRSLKSSDSKTKPVKYADVVESLVHAVFLEHLSESITRSAFRRFDDHFADFNDMRVSRAEEIVEMVGSDNSETLTAAGQVIEVLRAVFKRYNCVNLDSLNKIGKRQARVVLEKFDGITPFAIDYCMLTSLDAHAVPLNDKMISHLKENALVHPDSDRSEIDGFLTRQISASDGYDFYSRLRHASETGTKSKAGKKTTKKKAAVKKTVKKNKAVKKTAKKKTVGKKAKKKTKK